MSVHVPAPHNVQMNNMDVQNVCKLQGNHKGIP